MPTAENVRFWSRIGVFGDVLTLGLYEYRTVVAMKSNSNWDAYDDKILKYTSKDLKDIDMSDWLVKKTVDLRPLAIKWFDAIKACGPDVQPIFHDGYPIGCVEHSPFAYVNVFTSHMNLGFFYGVDLIDQLGMLKGSGKRMRHIKIRADADLDEKEIRMLIQASYEDIKNRLRLH